MSLMIKLLKIGVPFLALAENAARNLDQNDTGLDDQIADKLKEAVSFINQTIGAQSETTVSAARGYEAIMAFGNNVMSALEILRTSDMAAEEKTGEANRQAAMLSNPSLVYQAKHGKDADALAHFKTIAADAAANINAE